MQNDSTAVTGTAVAEIARLAHSAKTVEVFDFGGYTYTDQPTYRVNTDPWMPEPFESFQTLKAFAEYLEAEQAIADAIVAAVTPFRVVASSQLHGRDKHLRTLYAVAEFNATASFPFGTSISLEAMQVRLGVCFAPQRGDIEALIKFCASVRQTEEIGVADDGVSQTVSAKAGVAAVVETPVRNPWNLAPWRTFPEIMPPLTTYLLRFSRGPEPLAALHETGDHRWYTETTSAIAEWLRQELPERFHVVG